MVVQHLPTTWDDPPFGTSTDSKPPAVLPTPAPPNKPIFPWQSEGKLEQIVWSSRSIWKLLLRWFPYHSVWCASSTAAGLSKLHKMWIMGRDGDPPVPGILRLAMIDDTRRYSDNIPVCGETKTRSIIMCWVIPHVWPVQNKDSSHVRKKKKDRSVPHESCFQSSSLGIGRQPAKKTTPEQPDLLSRMLIAFSDSKTNFLKFQVVRDLLLWNDN